MAGEVEAVIVVVMVPGMANHRHGVVDKKVAIQMAIETRGIETVNLHNHDVSVGGMSRQLVQINHYVRH